MFLIVSWGERTCTSELGNIQMSRFTVACVDTDVQAFLGI